MPEIRADHRKAVAFNAVPEGYLPNRLTHRFAETDTGTPAIFCDEFNAGRLQRSLNGLEVVCHGDRSTCLKISNGTFANFRFRSQLELRKFDKSARGATLSGRHPIILMK
jgi:hypothetical protein